MTDEQKNRLQVMIYGQKYTIVGKASANYMRTIVDHIDEKMKQIAEANPRLDTTKIAVLTAVNLADEYFRLKHEYDELLQLLEEEGE